MLDQFQSIDPTVLADVARKCLNHADAQVAEWSVSPVSHEKVIESTAGLYRFQGHAQVDGEMQPWSAVLKILRKPDQEDSQSFLGWDYWKREMLAYQSGLLADLPAGMRAPRCFGVSETQTGGWVWMEDIQEPGGHAWSLANFQLAARRLGQHAGAYLVGRPLPNQPWLCRSLFRGMFDDGEWWAKFLNPSSPNNAWQRPAVQQVFSEARRSRVLQIWAEKWQFIEANERLPRVFCHNDAHRKNLMLLPGAGEEAGLVGIDWAFCGPGGLGNDLGELVGTSLSYFEVEPAQAQELESAVFEGYRAGLQDAGWSGNDRLAWLGYLISLALWWGGTLPSAAAELEPGALKFNVEAKYGRTAQDVLEGWKSFADFALDRADQARYWMGRLV
jgi:hypothetical protein